MKKTNPLSVNKIEEYAIKVRKQFSIPLDEAFPIYDILEMLSNNNLLTLQILENDNIIFKQGAVAYYNPLENFIYIKEEVLEDLDNGLYRSNFTLAHEFFHFLQHKVLNFVFEEAEESPKPFVNPEWQADEFAAQLLLPTKYLDVNDDILEKQFKVSKECINTRKLYYKRRMTRKKAPEANA